MKMRMFAGLLAACLVALIAYWGISSHNASQQRDAAATATAAAYAPTAAAQATAIMSLPTGTPPPSAANWSVAQQAGGTNNALHAVVCADGSNCWAVGNSGSILRTSDGGITWSAQQSGSASDLKSVSFPDANDGWAVGGDLRFTNESNGGVLLHTNDGGATWSTQTVPSHVDNTPARGLSDNIICLNSSECWLGGYFHTDDGGGTWTNMGASSATGPCIASGSEVVAAIDATHVRVLLGNDLQYTDDGGSSWQDASLPPRINSCGIPTAMTFADDTSGWVVDAQANVQRTGDGGNTWMPQDAGTHQSLNAVTFLDPTHGWIVGDVGTIRYTDDGGATWIMIPSGTTNNLYGIAFSDPEHALAVGDNGTILRISGSGA